MLVIASNVEPDVNEIAQFNNVIAVRAMFLSGMKIDPQRNINDILLPPFES